MSAVFPTALDEMPERRRWTREEYYRAGDLGLFGPEERLELIGGEVIKKPRPMTPAHAFGICVVGDAVRAILPSGYLISTQLPMSIGADSDPEPDVSVVAGSPRDFTENHPTMAALVVEVADSTRRFDRTVKSSLYASAGVPEYWILLLPDRALEIHRDPAPAADEPFGHHYTTIRRYTEPESVSPLLAPNASIRIADLLPPR